MFYSVTQRVRSIKQPYGGYLPIRAFSSNFYEDSRKLNSQENVHGSFVGLAVDYLTRFRITNDADTAFEISMLSAEILWQEYGQINQYNFCCQLLDAVKNGSIAAAVQLVAYDGVFRAGAIDIPKLEPDNATIENIEIMVQRGVEFLNHFGPLVKSGFTLEGGYTDTVVSGDGDYLTRDALIDFKVLRSDFNANHTLQVLMYYLMGLRSVHEEFKNVQRLALFNPRKNLVKFINVNKIAASVIDEVNRKVIGYRN